MEVRFAVQQRRPGDEWITVILTDQDDAERRIVTGTLRCIQSGSKLEWRAVRQELAPSSGRMRIPL
jgi:hypothetical protein